MTDYDDERFRGGGGFGYHQISPAPVFPVAHEAVKDLLSDAARSIRGTREQAVARELREAKARVARDQEKIDRLEARFAGLRRVREALGDEDPCDNGDILVIERTFESGPGVATGRYSYVALRVNGRYYVTGSGMSDRYTWSRLIEWLGGDAVSVVRVKAKTVEGSGKRLL